MAAVPETIERPDLDSLNQTKKSEGWIVTVFNNEVNTYEQVITILTIATHCSSEEAEMEAWEIDNLGRSVVHHGAEKECLRASEIIATIGIKVEVSQE